MVFLIILKGCFKRVVNVWEMNVLLWILIFIIRSGDVVILDVCIAFYVLFFVVINVVRIFGEYLEGFLSGKYYILLNYVFIFD